MNYKTIYIVNIVIFLVIFLTFSSCSSTAVSNVADAKLKSDQEHKPMVEILTSEGRRVIYLVELAITENQRSIGLMGRNSMDKNRGMLFVFPRSSYQSFWMKNTLLSLDMIFIGSDKKVVGVIENSQPLDESSLHVSSPSKYVLEVNSGQVKANSITPGNIVIFHDIRTK